MTTRLNDFRLSRKVSADSKTKFDERHVVMLTNVTSFATNPNNEGITHGVPAFNTAILNIQSNLVTYQTVKGLADFPITGYAAQNSNFKLALIGLLGNGMQAVYTYAMVTSNMVLADQMNKSQSTLLSMTNAGFLSAANTVINAVNPLATSGVLTTYNVTAASVSAWQTIWNQLNGSFSDPKNAIGARVALNASANSLLHDSMVILTNQSDTLVRQITDADYLASYYSNRKLNEHHITTKLKFTALSQLGKAIVGEVFVVGTDKNAVLDITGSALIDHVPPGVHSLMLTCAEGDFSYGSFEFRRSKTLSINVQINVGAPATIKVKEVDTETADISTAK